MTPTHVMAKQHKHKVLIVKVQNVNVSFNKISEFKFFVIVLAIVYKY